MRTTHNSRKDLVELNVLIYAKDQKKLWQYRNICYRINEKIPWKLEITLTSRMETVWNIITLLSGNIDIFISDEAFDRTLIKALELQLCLHSYHMIIKRHKEYIDIYKTNTKMTCIDHWEFNSDDLETKIFHAILKMQRTQEHKA